MDSFLQEPEKKKGLNKTMLGALLIGTILIIALIAVISLKPSDKQIQEQVLENAFHEGQPEFALYTKKISINTIEDKTTESPTAFGTIVMSIAGSIRNITGKTLTGLEIKVTVVDSFGNAVKDKTILVIPKQAEKLETGQSLEVRVLIEGFKKDDDRAQIRWKVTAIKVE